MIRRRGSIVGWRDQSWRTMQEVAVDNAGAEPAPQLQTVADREMAEGSNVVLELPVDSSGLDNGQEVDLEDPSV